jgi:hypothetical protein
VSPLAMLGGRLAAADTSVPQMLQRRSRCGSDP